jgi:hypothetical protein
MLLALRGLLYVICSHNRKSRATPVKAQRVDFSELFLCAGKLKPYRIEEIAIF